MEWIEAALAFAVVMMLLSTAVTVIMEAAHNVLRIREKGLRRLVESVYVKVILPRLPPLTEGATSAGFVATVTGERYLPVQDNVADDPAGLLKRLGRWFRHLVYRTVNATQRMELTTLEFVERLAETPAGRQLLQESERRGEDYLNIFLADLASKYEDFSHSASEYFARRAKLTSTLIALALAFSLNVDAIRIFETLLNDSGLRDTLVSQGEDVASQMKASQQRLGATADQPGTQFSQEELDASIRNLESIVDALDQTGLPIGWSSVPWREADGNDGTAEGKKGTGEKSGAPNDWLRIAPLVLGWVFSVILAGLLIGLGGPFWFNVFRKLGALAGMARGMQTPVQKNKEQVAPAEVDGQLISRVFLLAARGNALASEDGSALAGAENEGAR